MSPMIRSLFVLVLLGGTVSYAQLPNVSFEHITDRDGMPSRSVHCAAEDSSGFMWFGTRKCLTRYDGYSFRAIGDVMTLGVTVDQSGTVYSSTDKERLLRIDTRSLTSKTIVGQADGGAYNTFVDSFGNVWFSDRGSINRYDPATGKVRRYPMSKTTWMYNKGSFVEDSRHTVWVLGMEVGLFRFDRKADKLICAFGDDCPRPNTPAHLVFRKGFIDKDDSIWIPAQNQGLMRFDTKTGQTKLYPCPNAVLLTVCDGTDEAGKRLLWVGTDKALGVFRPETGQFTFFDNLIPQQFIVYAIVPSQRTGIVWVCTSEGLLKYDPHNQFIKTNRIPATIQPVNAILIDKSDPTGQTVWLSVSYRGLYKWNRATNQTTFYPFPHYSDQLEANWLIQAKDNTLWVGCNQWKNERVGNPGPADNQFEGIFRFDPAAGRYLPTPFTIHHTFFSAPFYSLGMLDRKGRFWIINHYEGVHVIDPATNREIRLWPKEAHTTLYAGDNWVLDILEDSRGQVWLTTTHSLFRFDESAHTFHRIKTGPGMLDMAEGPDGNLWAVGWPGLVKLDKSGTILRTWTPKDGLYDPECRRVLVDAQNRIWLGTYDGLHQFDERKNTFRRFTVNDGLLSNNTMMGFCLTDRNELLVGNTGGWNTLDITALAQSAISARLHLTEVRINNQSRAADWSKPVGLAPDETAVRFDFSALNYRKPTDNTYAYYLEGLEKTWIDAGHSHQAFYTNLDPGAYIFHARLAGPSGSELRVPFTIAPFYYETGWFRLLLLVSACGLLLFIYRSRLSFNLVKAELRLEEATRQRKEAEYNEEVAAYQLKLSETEMTALRSQMNPHFIFNCLNSIKLYTLDNDTDKASDYLTKFSRLIRLVLENSRSERVTLQSELEALQLYIELEAMRFKQKVQFSINVSPEIDQRYLRIPPLLLQPYVENAIWHGLMHKAGGGMVSVAVSQPRENLLHIEITDDGVGRQRALELKSKSAGKHKSFGMQITADRIQMINQLYNIHTQAQVVDLVDSFGEACGTRVILQIPV